MFSLIVLLALKLAAGSYFDSKQMPLGTTLAQLTNCSQLDSADLMMLAKADLTRYLTMDCLLTVEAPIDISLVKDLASFNKTLALLMTKNFDTSILNAFSDEYPLLKATAIESLRTIVLAQQRHHLTTGKVSRADSEESKDKREIARLQRRIEKHNKDQDKKLLVKKLDFQSCKDYDLRMVRGLKDLTLFCRNDDESLDDCLVPKECMIQMARNTVDRGFCSQLKHFNSTSMSPHFFVDNNRDEFLLVILGECYNDLDIENKIDLLLTDTFTSTTQGREVIESMARDDFVALLQPIFATGDRIPSLKRWIKCLRDNQYIVGRTLYADDAMDRVVTNEYLDKQKALVTVNGTLFDSDYNAFLERATRFGVVYSQEELVSRHSQYMTQVLVWGLALGVAGIGIGGFVFYRQRQ